MARHDRLFLLPVFLLALAGCSSSSSGDAAPSPWVGDWSCSGPATIKHISPPAPDEASKDQSTLSITTDGATLTVSHHQATDAAPCIFHWTTNGNAAAFVLPQSCPKTLNGHAFTASYKSGSATVTGDTIQVDRVFDLGGSAVTDAGAPVTFDEEVTALGTTCSRTK
jgi:hypothetical protein